MCVTSAPALIRGTQTVTYATKLSGHPFHVNFYQNRAKSLAIGGNCMFLNYPGSNLSMVDGPQHTYHLMSDMTAQLEELVYVPRTRIGASYGGAKGMSVVEYGDYTTILCEGPDNILSLLDEVRPDRRPQRTKQLEEMVQFYMSMFPHDSFSLSCFSGQTEPRHPIAVRYIPRNPRVLTAPGLDGHDGNPPEVGDLMQRDFTVGFALQGASIGVSVPYRDPITGASWAPSSVAGFVDNRPNAFNLDYMVLASDLIEGYNGQKLAERLLMSL